MWWREHRLFRHRLAPIAAALVAGSLTAGCFEPLYGSKPALNAESVQDRLAAIEIQPIPARQGTPQSRIAVAMRNALQYDLNGNGGAIAPTHQLKVTVGTQGVAVIIDVQSGRPTAEVEGVIASYQLVEIATGKVVVSDSAYAHVDTDSPGSQQRFAQQRAERDAVDRATQVVAETIKNRLASFFVAGT